MRKARQKFHELSAELLLDSRFANDPVSRDQYVIEDAGAIVARDHNRTSNKIILPLQDTPGGVSGNNLPMTPQNAIVFDLPEAEAQEFHRCVCDYADDMSVDAIFKRSWNWLNGNAWWAKGVRPHSKDTNEKKVEKKETKAKHPDQMTQKEFEQWRIKNGAKKY